MCILNKNVIFAMYREGQFIIASLFIPGPTLMRFLSALIIHHTFIVLLSSGSLNLPNCWLIPYIFNPFLSLPHFLSCDKHNQSMCLFACLLVCLFACLPFYINIINSKYTVCIYTTLAKLNFTQLVMPIILHFH